MAAKKNVAKKKSAKKVPAKVAAKPSGKAIASRYSKTQILTDIAESTDLSRKQVGAVIDELSSIIEVIQKELVVNSFTECSKLQLNQRPAQRYQPIHWWKTIFKAKPASIMLSSSLKN